MLDCGGPEGKLTMTKSVLQAVSEEAHPWNCSTSTSSVLTRDTQIFFFFFFFNFDASVSQEQLEGCAEPSDVQRKANSQGPVWERGSSLGWGLWPAEGGSLRAPALTSHLGCNSACL